MRKEALRQQQQQQQVGGRGGRGSVASSVYSSRVHGFTPTDAGASPTGAGAGAGTRVPAHKAAELDALEEQLRAEQERAEGATFDAQDDLLAEIA